MASAGIPIVKALDGLSEHPGLVRPVFSTVRALESGHSLTRSFALGGFQDPAVIGMLQLGESTGTLSKVISELAALFRWRAQLRAELKARLTYPVILAVACALLVGLGPPLLLRPILDFLAQSGASVPPATRLVTGLVHIMSTGWFWAGAVAMLGLSRGALVAALRRRPERWEGLASRSPAGRFFQLLASVRFAKALGSALASGYPLLGGVELACQCSGSYRMVEDGRQACSRLIAGATPEQAFEAFASLDPLIRQAITLGMASGTVETLLEAVTRLQQERLRDELERTLTLLEPFLLAFMGGMVGLCILATVSPMMSLLQGVL